MNIDLVSEIKCDIKVEFTQKETLLLLQELLPTKKAFL